MQEDVKKGIIPFIKTKQSLLCLIIFIAAIASFFMQWAVLRPPEADGTVAQSFSMSALKLITQSGVFTPKHEAGVFAGMNLLSELKLLYAVPMLAIAALALMFTKYDLAKRVVYWFAAISMAVVPVYSAAALKESTARINEIESAVPGFGAVICFLAGIGLAVVLIKSKKRKAIEADIFEEKEEKLKKQYLILSLLSLFCMAAPFLRIHIPSGLNKTTIYTMSLLEFLRISPDIKVISFFARFGIETGLGAAAVFYAVPIMATVTISLLFIKKSYFRKLTALVNSLLLFGASTGIFMLLSDNTAYFEGIAKTSMHLGAYLMFGVGACLFAVFVSDKREAGFMDASSIRMNHTISYAVFSLLSCMLFVMPTSGLSADIANGVQITGVMVPAGMAYPLNAPAAVKLLGQLPLYIVYLIPVLAVLSMAGAFAGRGFMRKTAAYVNSALLIISPVVIYTLLGRAYGDMGIVKLRFSSVMCIAAGIGLLITALTDRQDEFAHNNMMAKVKKAFEVVVTASFAVIQLYPLVWLFLSSFKNNSEIFSGKVLALPKVWHFENYSRVMFGAHADETIKEAIARSMARQKDMTLFKFIIGGGSEGNIIRYFMNSVFVVVVTVAVVILIGAMASYAISRIKWKHSSLLFTFFILGMMIPVHVALSPLYVVFAGMNLIDSLWSLIIPYIGFGLPICIIVICGFMESIPYEIEESATIDGANIFTVFFKIIIPMVMPAISTVLIFVFLQSWNELMFATSFINSGVNRTITVGINSIAKSQYNTEYALIFAGLVIASLPTIIIYLAGSQQVQKSLIVGAVKG